MNLQSLAMLAVAAAVVIAGVVIKGAEQSPWNLAMSYLLPVVAIERLRSRPTVEAGAVCAVVALSMVGLGRWARRMLHRLGPCLCTLAL